MSNLFNQYGSSGSAKEKLVNRNNNFRTKKFDANIGIFRGSQLTGNVRRKNKKKKKKKKENRKINIYT